MSKRGVVFCISDFEEQCIIEPCSVVFVRKNKALVCFSPVEQCIHFIWKIASPANCPNSQPMQHASQKVGVTSQLLKIYLVDYLTTTSIHQLKIYSLFP